jgi:hypothetical protein
MSENINLFHVLGVAPFLGYIAYKNIQKQEVHPGIYYALMILVVFTVIYHVWRYMKKTNPSQPIIVKTEGYMRRCIPKSK